MAARHIVFDIAPGRATLLGGREAVAAAHAWHPQRVPARDVLTVIVIALLGALSYVRDVSYYIAAALRLALLAPASGLVVARDGIRGGRL